MPRLRTRLTTKENIDVPAEIKSSKIRGTAGSRVVAAKKKGNDDKLIDVNTLAMLQSPVLRDRTNLTIKPTIVDVLKKGIEDEEADDEVTKKPAVKATRTRQKKIEEVMDVKAAIGRTRTRRNKVDVEETVNLKPSTSSETSNMIITDDQDNVPVKNVTAKSKDGAEKKLSTAKRTRLVEQKSESRVSTRAKKVGFAEDKLKPLQKDSDDIEENLSSNEADDDGSKDSSPKNDDDVPKVVKKKSAEPSVTSNKRSSRARKTKKVDKPNDGEEKSSKEANDNKPEDSSPEITDNESEDVKKQSANKKKASVISNKRSLRARKTKEVIKPKDVEEKSSNEADNDQSEDSSPETGDKESENVKKQSVNKKKASLTSTKRSSRSRKTKEVIKPKDVEEKSSNEADNDQSEDSSPETGDKESENVKKQSVNKKKASLTSTKRSSRARKTKEVNKPKDVEGKLSNQADNDQSEDSSPETDGLETQETDKPTGKKFFKNFVPTAHYKVSPVQKKRLGTRQKNVWGKKVRGKVTDVRMSASFRLRQTTLKESLANVSKKALRTRSPQKKSSKNSSPSKKITKKRGPVYKEILEEGNTSKKDSPDKIYEFSYDLNDSQERKIIRKKKKTTRRAPVKRNKASTTSKKTVSKKEKPTGVTTEAKLPEKIVTDQPVVPASIPEEPAENNQVTIMVTAEVYDPPSPEPFFDDEPFTAEKESLKEPARPVVISCQELSSEHRINWTTTPVQPKPTEKESSGPRQYSQRPSKQIKTMLNTSLIRRSLSPISKANPVPFIEEDNGSPWRLVPSCSFSRVKNVFQSTPQGKKFTTLLGKVSAVENKRLSSNMDKIEETNDENLGTKQNDLSENIQINNSKSPRKFGTEISNVNNTNVINQAGISPSKSPRKFGTDLSNSNNSTPAKSPLKKLSNSSSVMSPLKKKLSNSSATSPLKKKLSNSSVTSPLKKKLSKSLVLNENRSTSRGKISVTNVSEMETQLSRQNASADETLDKENSAPNLQSPSKTPRKNSRSLGSSFGSPFKGFSSNKSVENSSLGSPFKGFPSNKPVEDTIVESPFKGFPSNQPIEDTIVESPFKGFPNDKPIEDTIVESPSKSFPSNEPVEDSNFGSPFKGFPSESPASTITKIGQELSQEIEPQPDIESRSDIETQPDIEPLPEIEAQPDIETQQEIESEPVIAPQPDIETQPEIDPEPVIAPQPDIENHPEVEPQPDIETQPDFEPQPGPSGLQKSSPPANTWKLKQSNLNRFLNLPEMPTSTRISTPHGLFEDLNTSPIEININKNANKTREGNVGNAFGFDDDDDDDKSDDANTSSCFSNAPIEPKKIPAINAVKTKTVKAVIHNNEHEESKRVTRISTGAINKALRSNKKDDEIEQADIEAAPAAAENPFVRPTPNLIEPVTFLDTFDLSTEVGTENVNKSVGLFSDVEPVIHYTEPPRFSYKRKRCQRLMSCGDSEEDSDDDERSRPIKKKKLSKAEREQNKKMEEWAKMMNNSFKEIDHFNLVVE